MLSEQTLLHLNALSYVRNDETTELKIPVKLNLLFTDLEVVVVAAVLVAAAQSSAPGVASTALQTLTPCDCSKHVLQRKILTNQRRVLGVLTNEKRVLPAVTRPPPRTPRCSRGRS